MRGKRKFQISLTTFLFFPLPYWHVLAITSEVALRTSNHPINWADI